MIEQWRGQRKFGDEDLYDPLEKGTEKKGILEQLAWGRPENETWGLDLEQWGKGMGG